MKKPPGLCKKVMKIKRILIVVTSLFFLTSSVAAYAQDGFEAGLSYDLYGSWGTRDREDFDNGQAGFGAGINYFFTPHFGVSAETYIEEIDLPNHLDLSAIARWPLSGRPIAPYAFAGFGRQWEDVSQWTLHLGIGLEYSWSTRVNAFVDGRAIWADESSDLGLFRLGLRFRF
jgi:hypothetical protein